MVQKAQLGAVARLHQALGDPAAGLQCLNHGLEQNPDTYQLGVLSCDKFRLQLFAIGMVRMGSDTSSYLVSRRHSNFAEIDLLYLTHGDLYMQQIVSM
jgi:hypothetical protein